MIEREARSNLRSQDLGALPENHLIQVNEGEILWRENKWKEN